MFEFERKSNEYAWNTVYTYVYIYINRMQVMHRETRSRDTFNNFMLLAKDV